MNNILEVREFYKNYGDFTLNNITFDVPSGYIMGFIGPNGAGKTTTIKLILDIIKADAGSVKLFGGNKSSVTHNDQIGIVFDAPLYADDWGHSKTWRQLCRHFTGIGTRQGLLAI